MTFLDKLNALAAERKSKAGERIWAQLAFCSRISYVNGKKYDEMLEGIEDFLLDKVRTDGVITNAAADKAQEMLRPLYAEAKSYKIKCIGHAHIDMNWMWGWQETVSITVDTFRTMLDLLKEYPSFTFAQSQASTYRIIEEYCPSMLDEIRAYIREGRWEVTASEWVEPDKNMPGGESLSRHILYTKKYLNRLLGLDYGYMNLDFVPDTFGHNKNVPEILSAGGVTHMYHCRGFEGDYIYKWRSESGAETLCYREPYWYNADINSDVFTDVPLFCDRYKIKEMLKVYGVGDHGGGPTRRDIDKIIEMSSWPAMPDISFGTFHGYFDYLETVRDTLPVVNGELNYVFTGCYTTQTRIKAANRTAEKRLYESEMLSAAATLAGSKNKSNMFEKAWINTLFNHFHDIIPGSGVRETREYALGVFQNALACTDTNANEAMRYIARSIDTSCFADKNAEESRSEGAGVGFFVGENEGYGLPCAERGSGQRRVYHFFNTSAEDYKGVAHITVWDWAFDAGRACFSDKNGESTPINCTGGGTHYWGHEYKTFAVLVEVPAYGYSTYVLSQSSIEGMGFSVQYDPRCDHFSDDDIVLENNLVRAVFSRRTAQVISFTDKESGKEFCSKPSAYFRYIIENPMYGATAWRVGPYIKDVNLNEEGAVRMYEVQGGGLKKWLRYDLPFGTRSRLDVQVVLEENSRTLEFCTSADFQEIGNGAGMPQLAFTFPVSYAVQKYRYDVPFGTIDRADMRSDVPSLSFAAAIGDDENTAVMITDNKYGYRGTDNSLSVTLIRASFDPDPQPEVGIHKTRIGICASNSNSPSALIRLSQRFNNRIASISVRPSAGKLALDGRLVSVTGNVFVSGMKISEDGRGIIMRLYAAEEGKYCVSCGFDVSEAYECDTLEQIVASKDVSDGKVCGELKTSQSVTLLLCPKKAIEKYTEKSFEDEFSKPWGSYRTIDKTDGYCIKTLTVNPGQSLSLQSHAHREEFWTVASGKGKAFVADETKELTAGVSVYIPTGAKHRLINDGDEKLVVSEVQRGDKLDENDITRYEDVYGRA